MRNTLISAAAVCVLALLSGCASLGVPQPQSFSERLAAGYTSVTAVRQTATILLDGRVISSSDAANVQRQADVAREGLDVARTLEGVSAESKLSATLQVLDAAQGYLCARAPTNPNCRR